VHVDPEKALTNVAPMAIQVAFPTALKSLPTKRQILQKGSNKVNKCHLLIIMFVETRYIHMYKHCKNKIIYVVFSYSAR